jgi:outer membrane protein assembly factor BamB
VAVLVGSVTPGTVRAAVIFAPPDDAPDAATELKTIERELADRKFAAAATRLDALLAARGDLLANLTEGTLTSVAAWVDGLPPDVREGVAAEYAKSFATPAKRMLESLHASRVPKPEDLYALARRYPMTPAAGEALAGAGDLSLRLGDLPAAQAFYELALREGPAAVDEARAARLESLRKINGGTPVPPPTDLGEPARRVPAERLPLAGPAPFDATWYGSPSAADQTKFFPAAYDDRMLLATWRGVAMFRGEAGQLVWRSAHPKPVGGFWADRSPAGGRGALFAPAALCDVHGRPVVVVARYPGAANDGQYVLHGLSAADGGTLWTTETTDQRKDVSYAGLPVVSGRYVYSLAVAKTGFSSGTLILSAVDATTGAALWQTALGSVVEQGDARAGDRKRGRAEPLNVESFAELSEPAVAGDLVYVAPNCGSIIAVGRFDGKVRWVHVYREPPLPDGRELKVRPNRWLEARDAERAQRVRYRSTPAVCGDVVVAMPQDVPALIAVDRAGGRRLWDTDLHEGFGLAGASGNVAVLCGAQVSGIDAVTAKLKWKYAPRGGAAVTGPAVVVGQTVVVPLTGGTVQLDASNGTERAAYAVPNVRRALQSAEAKQVLTEGGATRAFGVPQR